jgi:adenylate kinase family enzyme
VIVQRFQAYEKDTLPLISFYQKRELLKTIDCEKPIEEIFQEALKGV